MTEKTKIIAGMEIQEDVLKLRIEKEQLEQENHKLLDVINNQDVKIADLEEQIKQIEKVSDYNADQLTKAKELLKRCYENYIYLEPLRSEINQFLEEIEK